MSGFAIVAPEDMETAGNWLLVRRALELKSFGINMVDIEPGERIPEHDETGRDQEEIFLALSGDATIVIDGEEHPLPGRVLRPARPSTHAHGREQRQRADPHPHRVRAARQRLRADGLGLAAQACTTASSSSANFPPEASVRSSG
jgi:quercetin dioxygenase-like cupin family protein